MSRIRQLALIPMGALAVAVLGACATVPPRVELPAPLPRPQGQQASAPDVDDRPSAAAPTRLTQSTTPVAPFNAPNRTSREAPGLLPPLEGAPISATLEDLPLPAFINETFGNLLGLNFQLEGDVGNATDLVTLRVSEALPPRDFYLLVSDVMRRYGLNVRYVDGVVLVARAGRNDTASDQPPLIISGRALPEVPVSHRPLFQVVELNVVRPPEITALLTSAFQIDGLEIKEDIRRNALILSGRPAAVRQAIEAIRVLDQPFMRGRKSTRLEPAFLSATDLAKQLVDALVVQGYAATSSIEMGAAITILPVASSNTLLMFAADAATLQHAVQWARTLDRPNLTGTTEGMFYYPVRNTEAAEIAEILSGAVQPAQAGEAAVADESTAAPGARRPPASTPSSGAMQGQLIVDGPRNALIFRGSPVEWERMLQLIRQMDRSARQVMIEVTIAEVSLDENQQFGVSWFAKDSPGRFNGSWQQGVLGAAVPGTGAATTGLTYLLDIAGQNRASLRAFASDSRVSILSTPRLLVKSGEEASIDVGTEVPIITAQTTSAQETEGSSNLLQSVQYRKTGIILNVTPTVYSDDRIDLRISQEVSEALPLTEDSTAGSPSIFNRAVSTSLSLRDGGSIVIAGLMSNNTTKSDSGVPFLKDVPGLGNLFKTRSDRGVKTELVLMIVPYIIDTDEDADELTDSIASGLELLEIPDTIDTLEPVERTEGR